MVPFKYPRLDHLPSVMESSDQPATIAAVRVGIARERTPDCLHERYLKGVLGNGRAGGCETHIGLNPSEPVHEQDIEEEDDDDSAKT